MAINQKSRWDDVGVEPPAGSAKYTAGEQPIAEWDNWFNRAVVDDIASLNAWLDNLGITKVYIDTSANRPASGSTKELYIETDTGRIYRGTGTGWQLLTTEWNAILNKPSSFPPSVHASSHASGGSDELSLDASQITSGRLSLSRLPTSATANRYLVVRTANADPIWDVIKLSDLSIDTHLLPVTDAEYDLGSGSRRWRHGYFSGNVVASGAVYAGGSEVITSDRTLKNTKIVCANKGLTAVTVTETTATLKQTLTPDSGYFGFPYIEGINIVATNPINSGVTLYLQVRVLLDNNTEVALHDWEMLEPGYTLDDWLRWIYDIIPHARAIKEIRLYAYCSSTPATGYEPKVNVNKVTGVMC